MHRKFFSAALLAAALITSCSEDPTAPVERATNHTESTFSDSSSTTARASPGFSAAATSSAPWAFVTTDKSDYMPGDTVLVTGVAWQPGETVLLEFVETPIIHPAETLYTTADSMGDIRSYDYLIQPHDTGQTFTLNAKGQSSGSVAEATFTDSHDAFANLYISGLPQFSPTAAGSITIGVSGGRDCTTGTVSIRDQGGNEVRAFRGVNTCSASIGWDGTNSSNVIVPDGHYTAQLFWLGCLSSSCFPRSSNVLAILVDNTGPAVTFDLVPGGTTGQPMNIRGTVTFATPGVGLGAQPTYEVVQLSDGQRVASDIVQLFGSFPSYQWQLVFTPPQAATYRVIVTARDIVGNTGTRDVQLVAQPACTAPSITTQPPATLTKTVGDQVTLTAAATGTGLTYRWQKDGQGIAGATGTGDAAAYTIASARVGDAGSYTVLFTACNTTRASSASQLTVNAGPTTTTITSRPLVATYGMQDVGATARVTASTATPITVAEGSVAFTLRDAAGSQIGGPVAGGVDGTGLVSARLPLGAAVRAGSYTVEAAYRPPASGANFLTSTATPEPLTVRKASTTTSITSVSPSGSSLVNGSVTFTFNVSPQYLGAPSGTVEIRNGTAALCSAAPAAGSCSFTPNTVGALELAAHYLGDDNFEGTLSPTQTHVVKYNFIGLDAPVDRPSTLNLSKAGQAIPLKWRLLDANNAPASNLAAISVKVASSDCSTSAIQDVIEEYASGASGLQNLGGGYYQFNWKTPTTWANSCRAIGLDFGNGYVEWPLANFQFRK